MTCLADATIPVSTVSPSTADGLAAVNPCTLCAPLGAVLASAGLAGGMSLLHGAQGCATYIRRYLISHFREPVDVASSSFGESAAIFGGEDNLGRALDNIVHQYAPCVVTVATTCVAETIGEDMGQLLARYRERTDGRLPVIQVSTPSYKDGHVEGFHATVLSMVKSLAIEAGESLRRINLLPPILSPADLRHLREMTQAFGIDVTILPDYSDTLDGPIQDRYHALPEGGTSLEAVAQMARSMATIDLTMTGRARSASGLLEARGVMASRLRLPIGIRNTDTFCAAMSELTGSAPASWLTQERGRLLDSYADGHKYVFGKRVALFGDPELVVAISEFLLEIGAVPVLVATGARNRALSQAIAELGERATVEVLEDTDFVRIEAACRRLSPDLLIGNSKGYRTARALGVPLIRVGFPIHDRVGAGRLLHVGYRGTSRLFDSFINVLLERQQDDSPVGFSYL
jgi:nitrogenase molybdenum-iron protein NifN